MVHPNTANNSGTVPSSVPGHDGWPSAVACELQQQDAVGHADFMKSFFSTKLDGRKSNIDHYRI
jgi:hypothetical protein